jgi:hypothetical protein
MLKNEYSKNSKSNMPLLLRHRPTRQLVAWILAFALAGALLYRYANWPQIIKAPGQASVIIHKTAGEIDVKLWPEEKWYEGPRNETELEKAALVMLVRFAARSLSFY